MPPSAIDDVVDVNTRYAATGVPIVPRRNLAIVTCMDARIDTTRAFGLDEGQSYIIRNAGGRIADAIRSLVICQELLGVEEVAIIHHTDCGMLTVTDASLREQLTTRGVNADYVAFGPFADLDESVRIDLQDYARSPLVRHDIPVRGFVFDVGTGLLREVS